MATVVNAGLVGACMQVGQGCGVGVGELGLTFLLHASPEALLKPAVTALVPLIFVYHALSAKPGEDVGMVGWRRDRFFLLGQNQDLAVSHPPPSSLSAPCLHPRSANVEGSMDCLKVHFVPLDRKLKPRKVACDLSHSAGWQWS